MAEIITACILFAIAITAFIFSIRAFRCKGFLLNNAYIYASKKERETMDKKPYYRQTAIVFALIGLIFLTNGLAVLIQARWTTYLFIVLMVTAVIYAISSSVAIGKKKAK